MTDRKNANPKLDVKSGDLPPANIISNYDQLSNEDKKKLIKMTGALKEAKPKIESLIVSSLKKFCAKTSSNYNIISRGRRSGFTKTLPESYFSFVESRKKKNLPIKDEPFEVITKNTIGSMYYAEFDNIQIIGGDDKRQGYLLRDPESGVITWSTVNYSNVMPITDLINIEVVLALPSENHLNTLLPTKKHYGEFIFLGGRRNSAHLLWEFFTRLPIIFDLCKDSNAKILVSSYCKDYIKPWFEIFKIPDSRISYFDGRFNNEYEKLKLISCPFRRLSKTRLAMDKSSFFRMRNLVLDQYRSILGKKYHKVYITRSDASHRRVINEDEVIKYLREHGFLILTLSEIPVSEQLRIIVNAGVFISAVGAGSSMSMFAREDAMVIEISEKFLGGMYNGRVSGLMLNQTFNRIVSVKGTPRPTPKELRNDYYCNLEELKDTIKSIELLEMIENNT